MPVHLPEEKLVEAVAALNQAGGVKTVAARNLNLDYQTFRHRIELAARKGMLGTKPVMPGFEISQTSAQLDDAGNVQKEWIKQRPERGDEFAVPEGHSIKGVSALVDASGRTIQQWVKTKEDGWSFDDLREALREALTEFAGQAPYTPPPETTDDELVAVYPAADWHIGLLSWGKETGQNFDLKIAKRTIEGAMERLVACTPPARQAILLGLGDALHSDGYKNATPQSGNLLDVDGRYPRVLQVAAELFLKATTLLLEKHERVLIRLIPGNHDPESAIALTLALSLFFKNEPRVTVDDDPGLFWWWEWGSVLLGAAHGDKSKMTDLPLIMAARNNAAWGRTKFRHIYTGHSHQQSGIEKSGVTVESFRTPAAQDAWAHGMGFGAGRSMTSITLHRELGELSRHRANIV